MVTSGSTVVTPSMGFFSARKVRVLPVEQRVELAGNPETPVKVLNILRKDKLELVRIKLASNPSLPAKLFHKLLRDRSRDVVVVSLMRNPSIPYRVVTKLIGVIFVGKINIPYRYRTYWKLDIIEIARYLVAQPYADERFLLHILRKTSDLGIGEAMAANPNIPVSVIKVLLDEKRYSGRTHYHLVDNPSTPDDIYYHLINSSNGSARARMAYLPRTSPSLMYYLSIDHNYQVRAAVAQSEFTSIEILLTMEKDKHSAVAGNVHYNPKYITYQRNLVYKDMGLSESESELLPGSFVDEIWKD